MTFFKNIPDEIEFLVIGGSAGSYSVVRKILASLPGDFRLPVILCLHRLREVRSGFAESLNIGSRIAVTEATDKESIRPGKVYLSPANYHLLVEPARTIALSTEEELNYSRPSIDITFESAGYSLRKKMAGILLSGTNTDGARGLYSAFRNGATTIIQDPENAQFSVMPAEALSYFKPHYILKDIQIAEFINSLKPDNNA